MSDSSKPDWNTFVKDERDKIVASTTPSLMKNSVPILSWNYFVAQTRYDIEHDDVTLCQTITSLEAQIASLEAELKTLNVENEQLKVSRAAVAQNTTHKTSLDKVYRDLIKKAQKAVNTSGVNLESVQVILHHILPTQYGSMINELKMPQPLITQINHPTDCTIIENQHVINNKKTILMTMQTTLTTLTTRKELN